MTIHYIIRNENTYVIKDKVPIANILLELDNNRLVINCIKDCTIFDITEKVFSELNNPNIYMQDDAIIPQGNNALVLMKCIDELFSNKFKDIVEIIISGLTINLF